MTWQHWAAVGAFSVAAIGATVYLRRKVAKVVTKDDRAASDGIVEGEPAELARAAGVPVDVYSLGRLMQSEEGTRAGRIAVGWATRNAANRAKISVTRLVTRSKNAKVDGHYGRQDVGPKWAATTLAPTAETLELAKQIMAEPPKLSDPTRGAVQWDAPALQEKLHKKNPKKWKSAEEVAKKRQEAGRRLVMVPGVPKTRFWA